MDAVTVLLGVVFPSGCVIACVLIGRRALRESEALADLCADSADACAAAEQRVSRLADDLTEQQRLQDAPTEVIPAVDDPPLLTHGQQALLGQSERTRGKHARPANPPQPTPHPRKRK